MLNATGSILDTLSEGTCDFSNVRVIEVLQKNTVSFEIQAMVRQNIGEKLENMIILQH